MSLLDTPLLRQLLEVARDGVAAFDCDLKISEWNPVMAALTGTSAAAALGRAAPEVLAPILGPQTQPRLLAAVAGQPRTVAWTHVTLPGASGGAGLFRGVISTLATAKGEVLGGCVRVEPGLPDAATAQAVVAPATVQTESSRLRDEFMATLSHELKTPLNAIVGWSELLRLGLVATHDFPDVFEAIDRNARQQAQLIDTLLESAMTGDGRAALTIGLVRLDEIVAQSIESLRLAASAKQLTLIWKHPADASDLNGDGPRLRQVAFSILANAVKFSHVGGRIHVALERSEAALTLTISDQGHGIRGDFLPLIFERFSHEEKGRCRRFGGLGLSLSLTRQLIELHGGSIHAASAGENLGATFTIILPRFSGKPPHYLEPPNDSLPTHRQSCD